MKRVAACGVGLFLLSSACATQVLKPAVPATPTPAFVRWSQSGVPDKHLCVLPFTDQTGADGLAAYVRQSFAGHLSIKRFSDAELYEIDARLNAFGGDWKTQPTQWLGQTLQCDALVYGQLTTARRWYLGLYSQLTLAGEIHIVDAATGQSAARCCDLSRHGDLARINNVASDTLERAFIFPILYGCGYWTYPLR